MKRIFMIAALMLTALLTAQNATWTGTKTFGNTLKFGGVLQNNANTKILSLDATGRPGWRDVASLIAPSTPVATTPTLQAVLTASNVTNVAIEQNDAYIIVKHASPANEERTILEPGSLKLMTRSVQDQAILRADLVTDMKTFQFPDLSGTLLTSNSVVSATQTGLVNNTSLQELGGVDKLINGVRIGRGNNNIATNTVIGLNSLNSVSTGRFNTSVGDRSLAFLNTGQSNTAIGSLALNTITTQNSNTAIGTASQQIATGGDNTSLGSSSLKLTSGSANTAVGSSTLDFVTSGNFNVGIGYDVGNQITTGSNNTYIGSGTPIGNTSNTVLISAGTLNRLIIDSVGKTNLLNKLNIANTPIFNDNEVAVAGGLVIGDVYRTTTGVLMIVF